MPKITINRLGPIEYYEAEIKDYMVVTGPQASGKSTVAKSIFFFKNIKNILFAQVRKRYLLSDLETGDVIKLNMKNRLMKEVRSNFLQIFGSTWCMDMEMSLVYQYRKDVSIEVSLTSDPVSPNYIWIKFSRNLSEFLKLLDLSIEQKSALLPNAGLDTLFSNNQFVTIGLPLAVVMAIIVWIVLEKTKFGYELKATGMNKNAAKYCGMKEKRNIIITMMISGGLAGLGAGVFYLTGIEQWMVQQTSVPAMGFNGIAAAFLGGLNPIGTIFSSYFIQHITSGGTYVDKTMYCSQISDLISAFIIYMCGFVLFFKIWLNRYLDKRDEKRAAKEQEGGEA